jgi:hypothetical protein
MSVTRLIINAKEFHKNPKRSITNLLGTDIEILNYIQSDIVLNDGEVIADVFYKKLILNPFMIYFIKRQDMKPINPLSDNYIVKIDDIPVKIKTDARSDVIPIKIMATSDNRAFKYFGQVVKNPLSHFQTDVKYPNCLYLESNFIPQKLYPDDYSPIISKPVIPTKYQDLTLTTTIPTHGVLISPNTIPPPYFLHNPTSIALTNEDITLFKHYMMIETINYYNYMFLTSK